MYRPQFAYPAPSLPCRPLRSHISFDETNVPSFAASLSAGAIKTNIPLNLDQDAAFILRGWVSSSFGIQWRIRDGWSNELSNNGDANQAANFEFTSLYSESDGGLIVPLEPELYCPASGVFMLSLYNPTAVTQELQRFVLTLHGVKVYQNERCAA